MYWEKEENRKCRIWEWEEETWENVWGSCVRRSEEKEGWQENIIKILGEEGLREAWMRDLEKARGMSEKV